jgi:hypothetical protein
MKNLNLFVVSSVLLFSSISVAQPGPATTKLLWKIAVNENGRVITIDSTKWRLVKFSSGNADVAWRFIAETNYFEICLKSMVQPELIISYQDKIMSFPVINHFQMGYYKKVVLGINPQFDPEQEKGLSKAFFDDPEEHIRLQVDNSTDIVTICPRNILVHRSGTNSNSIPLNNEGLISITKYKTAPPYLYCNLDFTASVDTVSVLTDLKPRSHIRLNLISESPDGGVCPTEDSMVYYTVEKLPIFTSSLGSTYQLAIDGKPVNTTLIVPHKFIYIKSGLSDNWINAKEIDPADNFPDSRTVYYDRNYHIMISPKHPGRIDTLKITVVNRLSLYTENQGSFEFRIVADENKTYAWTKELQVAIWHGCSAGTKTGEASYQVIIPPVMEGGQYKLKFYGGLLNSTKQHTDEKHCFEPVPAEVVLNIR